MSKGPNFATENRLDAMAIGIRNKTFHWNCISWATTCHQHTESYFFLRWAGCSNPIYSPFIAGSLKHRKMPKTCYGDWWQTKKTHWFVFDTLWLQFVPCIKKQKITIDAKESTCLCALSNSFGNSNPCCPWNQSSTLPQSFPPRHNKETKRAQQESNMKHKWGNTRLISRIHFKVRRQWDHWLGSARQSFGGLKKNTNAKL